MHCLFSYIKWVLQSHLTIVYFGLINIYILNKVLRAEIVRMSIGGKGKGTVLWNLKITEIKILLSY